MATLKETLKRNDILVRQFGYNMTLYNFYKVLEIKGSTVKLYPLKSQSGEWLAFMQNEVKPIDTKCYLTSKIITKRFNKWNGVCIDKDSLFLYDKTRQYIENHAD